MVGADQKFRLRPAPAPQHCFQNCYCTSFFFSEKHEWAELEKTAKQGQSHLQ